MKLSIILLSSLVALAAGTQPALSESVDTRSDIGQIHPGGPAPLPVNVIHEERLQQAKRHAEQVDRHIRELLARRIIEADKGVLVECTTVVSASEIVPGETTVRVSTLIVTSTSYPGHSLIASTATAVPVASSFPILPILQSQIDGSVPTSGSQYEAEHSSELVTYVKSSATTISSPLFVQLYPTWRNALTILGRDEAKSSSFSTSTKETVTATSYTTIFSNAPTSTSTTTIPQVEATVSDNPSLVTSTESPESEAYIATTTVWDFVKEADPTLTTAASTAAFTSRITQSTTTITLTWAETSYLTIIPGQSQVSTVNPDLPTILPTTVASHHGTYTMSGSTFTWDDLPIGGGGIGAIPSTRPSHDTTPTGEPTVVSISTSHVNSESKTMPTTHATTKTKTPTTKPSSSTSSALSTNAAGRAEVFDGLGLVGAVVYAIINLG